MLPNNLIKRLTNIYNSKDFKIVLQWFELERNTVFRVNTLKSNFKAIEDFLNENNIIFEKINFLQNTYIIDKKYEYFLKWSRIFYDWKIYVQSITSQIPATLLELKKWDKILDATAAPGSKTTQISAILENSWEIIAIEKNQIRFDKLNYNIKLQWCINVKTIKTDAIKLDSKFPKWYFDKIILDAPCSAEWRMNIKNEKSFWFWSEKNILKNVSTQKNIIDSTINLLKKWWIFVYSTCTISPEENEEIVSYILDKYKDFKIEKIKIDFEFARNGITEFNWKKYSKETLKCLRILPSKISEGFFIAKFRRK